ncbi:hypothetical protein V1477_004639 [Vespula maculifrons]|uniref:Uncharacterized protein n=1 Tax=Vespula maculifrons TaxID=7453 RepID=A0ABD2CNA7_VESMC
MTETLEFYVSILFSIRYQPYGLESLAFRVSAAIATAVANVVVDAFLDFLPAAQLSVMLAVTTGIRRKRRPGRQYCPLNSIRRNVENSVRSQPNILWIAFVVRGK